MKVVIGLGNPGDEYVGTRHNVGFEVVEILARRAGARLAHDRRLTARTARASLGGEETLLVEPLAYMNLSGPVVARIVREKELTPADVLVVADDYHLPVAALRLRTKGSAGGHNGLKSIIGSLATDEFPRLRIGIGEAPPGGAVDFVLTRFKPSERKAVEDAYELGADCAEHWRRFGAASAMNAFNKGRSEENPSEGT
jgi:PTH1 family peptidyl-tRNA hydrolase